MYILQGPLLERKHGLQMGGEMHSSIKHLCGWCTVGHLQVKCKFVAISGRQSPREASHYFCQTYVSPIFSG